MSLRAFLAAKFGTTPPPPTEEAQAIANAIDVMVRHRLKYAVDEVDRIIAEIRAERLAAVDGLLDVRDVLTKGGVQ